MCAPRFLSPRAAALAVGLCLLGAACADRAAPLRMPPEEQLGTSVGEVLAAEAAPARLVAYDLSSEEIAPLPLPAGSDVVLDAFWFADGALAFVGEGRPQLYRVAADAEPEPLGEPLSADGFYDVKGSTALASVCREVVHGSLRAGAVRASDLPAGGRTKLGGTVRVLDIGGEATWRRIARGCVAALSPDGRDVVHSPDQRSLWITPIEGGAGRKLLDLSEIDLRSVSRKPFAVTGPVVWSETGIAVAVDAEGSDTVLRVSPEGDRVTPISIHPRKRDFGIDLAWQPEGSELAIGAYNRLAYVNVVGFVGLSEADDGIYRVLSMQPQLSEIVIWSPDGREVLVAGSDEPWVIARPDGTWVQRVPAGSLVPLDWRSP